MLKAHSLLLGKLHTTTGTNSIPQFHCAPGRHSGVLPHLVAEALTGEAVASPVHPHQHVVRLLHPTGFGPAHNPTRRRAATDNKYTKAHSPVTRILNTSQYQVAQI